MNDFGFLNSGFVLEGLIDLVTGVRGAPCFLEYYYFKYSC